MPCNAITRWRPGAATAIWTCLILAAPASAPADEFAEKARPVLERYCFSCHGGEEPEAGLDLSKFTTEEAALAEPELWTRAVERLNAFEMPPEGSDQLNDEERDRLRGWIEAHRKPPEDCNQLATDGTVNFNHGVVMSRRLSRDEYKNTVRDLTGVDLRPADAFPADGSGGEGFDNVGDTLYMSTVLLERYLAAARQVLEAALPEPGEHPKEPGRAAGSRQRVLIAEPTADLPPREAARRVVGSFARRAFRRPVEDAEVERLLGLFDRAQSRGESYVPSVRLALQGVLISPHFLFLVERAPPEGGVYRLGHYELAARLASFLWASAPDEELLRLAEEERLHDDETLRQQVRRMLADQRSRGFAESFATQWLDIGSLGAARIPDPERFPEFDDELARAMRGEAIELVAAVFREDRPLLELIDADYTFVNTRLAAHYGLPPVEGTELERVSLPDRNRGGVLGLGAVLTATSYPLRTSPVLRGKWVLNELLGTSVPPPQPNAGTLPEDDRQTDGLTLRQRLEQHRTNPECAACHQNMDPLGFGLENYDAIGRWRTEQLDQPIDSSGALPSGEKFATPGELKDVLLARKDQFLRGFARKMLGYGLARGLNQFDMCVIDDAIESLEASEYRSVGLVETIVLSYPFQHRFAKK